MRSILGLQRARLLGAAVGVLAEDGYAGFTAAAVCGRAGVSRRTFYEVFENREQCLVAVLGDAEQRACGVIAGLALQDLPWGERVRVGLWALLCLADEDPALARVCLVESQRAGGVVQAERERIIAALVEVVDEGRLQTGGPVVASRIMAEALVGAVCSVIATRLTQATGGDRGSARGQRGVRGVLGELAGMIVLAYMGPVAARREIQRDLPANPLSETVQATNVDPLAGLPMRLTYRTARVIQAVAELTASSAGASNSQIAQHAGITDAGQTSKLLWRLADHDLLENTATGSHARGEANQWRLTAKGKQLLRSITGQADTRWESAA